jgi:hypothetical protein
MASRRIRALAARLTTLPALLLVAVAIAQIALTRTAHLSPWSGGGFGMFSTTDSPARRHLHAWALRPGLRSELEIPANLEMPARRALALPVASRLQPIADALARIEEEQGDPDAAPLEAIVLQIFRAHYDAATLAPSGEMLRAVEFPAGTTDR